MRIPMFDAAREYAAHADEFDDSVRRVLAAGSYILGPEVEAFEAEVAGYLGVSHAVGCASGTDALWLALRALGVGRGDLVLTTPFTFFATASAVLNVGATPVFVDIDPATFNLDPGAMEAVLAGASAVHRRLGLDRRRARVILPVHLFGQPADMGPVMATAERFGLAVVEDAAQAFGATYHDRHAGAIGDAGCFSFFPTKNLGGFGDGGMVVTGRDDVALSVRRLRAHGAATRYAHSEVGTNSRLDEVQAALLRVRLRHLDAALAGRRRVAAAFDAALTGASGMALPSRRPDRTHTFNLYVARTPARDNLRSELSGAGIATAVHYPVPLHLQPALTSLGYRAGDFPAAEAASAAALSLPMSPGLSSEEVESITSVISAGHVTEMAS